VRRVALVPLAQHSAHVYADDARQAAEGTGIELACAPGWGQNARLLDAFAARILRVLGDPANTTVILTAHSLPRAVIEQGDPYEREVRASAAAIEKRLGADVRTVVVFQSQGMSDTPGGWLGPDIPSVLDLARARGDARVVAAPIGFLADHVETLYDLDIEAAAMARNRGLAWVRTPSLDDHDDLVEVLADVAQPLLVP
jgi:ferrochelatase